MTNEIRRPDPIPASDSEFFWEAADNGELKIQRCTQCRTFLHPPRPMCPECHSLEQEYVAVSGNGSVYSWCLPQHPKIPLFDYPLITALIELVEVVRLLSNIVDCLPEEVASGMPVSLCFAKTAGGRQVPQFRPTHTNKETN
jgi:uncharacterized OB-fold protein